VLVISKHVPSDSVHFCERLHFTHLWRRDRNQQ
jgi:hypothetical protein